MNNPLVSVIIPTYKRSDYLLNCIDSVIKQTYKNLEIIVVDDNGLGTEFQKSTEKNLQHLINSKSIIYIAHEINKNGSAARNTGFKASHGEFVNFMDDDDSFEPNKILEQVMLLSSLPESFGAVYCKSRFVCKTKVTKKTKIWTSNYNKSGMIVKDYLLGVAEFNTSALLFRRSVIEELGGFDESYVRHQDYELMTRFFSNYMVSCTKSDFLMTYDMSRDRGNFPSMSKLRDVRIKFIKQFESDLRRWGFYEELCHTWWFFNLSMSIESHQWGLIPEFYQRSTEHGKITLHEWMSLKRPIIRSLFYKSK